VVYVPHLNIVWFISHVFDVFDIIMFCTFDIISLVVQAFGGGMASSATTPQGS
jgi:hypothetical protein